MKENNERNTSREKKKRNKGFPYKTKINKDNKKKEDAIQKNL